MTVTLSPFPAASLPRSNLAKPTKIQSRILNVHQQAQHHDPAYLGKCSSCQSAMPSCKQLPGEPMECQEEPTR